jgi:hypothetical protein
MEPSDRLTCSLTSGATPRVDRRSMMAIPKGVRTRVQSPTWQVGRYPGPPVSGDRYRGRDSPDDDMVTPVSHTTRP